MNIIITGHKGYIGSVLKKYLEGFGYRVYGLDLRDVPSNDYTGIRRLITAIPYEVDAVVHLGAHSLLGPSVKDPFSYYDNNVVRSTDMLKALINSGWRGKFIFASSAAVYGNHRNTILEFDEKNPINPYGKTKLHFEHILQDAFEAYEFQSTSFRFFNVCGADILNNTGQSSDQPHIITSMCRAAAAGRNFTINGQAYETYDGTCVRDYIHVLDVCRAILSELLVGNYGAQAYNLSTGVGTSNLDLFRRFKQVTGTKIDFEIGPYRPGDPHHLVGSSKKFQTRDLKFLAHYNGSYVDNIIESAWKYYKDNNND